MNGLHYVNKMFNMVTKEQARMAEQKECVRDGMDIKSFEKDVKTLTEFYVKKHLFIKMHMIYKRFVPSYPGLPFIKLAAVYNTLNTSSHCKRLLADTTKNVEYKQGLEDINRMFAGDISEATRSLQQQHAAVRASTIVAQPHLSSSGSTSPPPATSASTTASSASRDTRESAKKRGFFNSLVPGKKP